MAHSYFIYFLAFVFHCTSKVRTPEGNWKMGLVYLFCFSFKRNFFIFNGKTIKKINNRDTNIFPYKLWICTLFFFSCFIHLCMIDDDVVKELQLNFIH